MSEMRFAAHVMTCQLGFIARDLVISLVFIGIGRGCSLLTHKKTGSMQGANFIYFGNVLSVQTVLAVDFAK